MVNWHLLPRKNFPNTCANTVFFSGEALSKRVIEDFNFRASVSPGISPAEQCSIALQCFSTCNQPAAKHRMPQVESGLIQVIDPV